MDNVKFHNSTFNLSIQHSCSRFDILVHHSTVNIRVDNAILVDTRVCYPVGGGGGGGEVVPYMGYIGMCRCEGYGFQAFYSSIGYINQSVWV